MQIQLNTDNNLVASEALDARVTAEVRSALERFAERITRVEVHLNDVNSDKSGDDDKRCMMEARVAGRQPLSVSHQAPTVELAIGGAAGRLARALDTVFGKQDAVRRSHRRPDDEGSA